MLLAGFIIALPSASVYAACRTDTYTGICIECVGATGGDSDDTNAAVRLSSTKSVLHQVQGKLMKASRKTYFALAALLAAATGTAYAACSPDAYRVCGELAAQCIANGTNEAICEYRYERCLVTKGCGPYQ